jgi:ankyrin repeat protein
MPGLFSKPSREKEQPSYQVADIYSHLRQRILDFSKQSQEGSDVRAEFDRLATMMETSEKDYCFTLVAYSDGNASLYFSSGGAVLGAGQHPEGAKAAKSFLKYSREFDNCLAPVSQYPLPSSGATRFYIIKMGTILSGEFKSEELKNNKSALSPLYIKGHELIATIRIITERTDRMKKEPPLIRGICDDSIDDVNKLLKEGTDPNTLDSDGTPALAFAVYLQQIEIIRALLAAGANPDIQFSNKERGYKNLSLVNFAATSGNLTILAMLKDAGANLENSDSTGQTPLMLAASRGHVEVLNYLIKSGCRLELKNESGYTALMFACKSGHLNCVKALIDNGANLNALDKDNSTPIMFAAQYGYNDIVKLLLAKGADPNAKGIHGLSALGFAKQNRHAETEKILAQGGE